MIQFKSRFKRKFNWGPICGGVIIMLIFTGIWYYATNSSNNLLSALKKCVPITNKEQLFYEQKTNDFFRIAIEGKAEGVPTRTKYMNDIESTNFLYLVEDIYEYQMHVTTKHDGKKTTTQITYSWDRVGTKKYISPYMKILNKIITLNDTDTEFVHADTVKLKQDMFSSGVVVWGYWYPRFVGDIVGNMRHVYYCIPNNINVVIAAIMSNNLITPLLDGKRFIYKGTRTDFINSLNADIKTYNIIFIVSIILVICGTTIVTIAVFNE